MTPPPDQVLPPAPARLSLFRRLLHFAGIDKAIGYTVLARGWGSCAGLVTVALIARHLTPAEQGYYYTFGSLVAMQLIFELGFSVVILQLATHEVAHLSIDAAGVVSGGAAAHARLASTLKKSVRWYTVASLLMASILIPGGWYFFSTNAGAHTQPVAWQLPWVCAVLASSITFQIDPIFSFLEGCGFVARAARARLTQSILGSLLAWVALLLHHGLFAPALLISGQAIAGLYWLYGRRHLLKGLLNHPVGEHAIDWWKEVWPFQWRIAVSYACGFFIFQLFNPVLFHFWGPTVAGRMGMSMSLTNALGGVAISWINTKSAPFGALIARREFATLDNAFFRAMRQSISICMFGSIVVWLGALYLNYRRMPFAQRLLPPLPFALLLFSMNINQIVGSMAIYLRAHKQEKFLLNSVLGAILVGISTFFLGRAFGPLGMTAGQAVIGVLLGLGFGSWTFFKYRRLWHAA